jgi:hypothetical protein
MALFAGEENFACGICLEICVDAVQSSCCAQILCAACVAGLKNKKECVMCRVKCNYVASPLARRLIANLKRTCPFCSVLINRALWDSHRYCCESALLECRVGGMCGVVLVRGEMLSHLLLAHSESLLGHFCILCEDAVGGAGAIVCGGAGGAVPSRKRKLDSDSAGGGGGCDLLASSSRLPLSGTVGAAALTMSAGTRTGGAVLPERTLTGHSGHVRSLAVLPDGRLCSGSYDNTIKIWDVSTGECARTLTGHSGHVYSLAVLPDGRLCCGAVDNTIKIWDVK